MSRRALPYVLAAAAILFLPGIALARLGGGEGYGGGGGGGGGGGDGEGACLWLIIRLLLELCIEYPAVGIPLTALFIVGGIIYAQTKGKSKPTYSMDDGPSRVVRSLEGVRSYASLAQLREKDPLFSKPLFLDFVQLLFARYHVQRGKRDLAALAPYMSKGLIDRAMQGKDLQSVDQVLIAASKVVNVNLGDQTRINVRFLANYRETSAGQTTQFYTEETWTFVRDGAARSKPPEELTRLGCPACGSAEEAGGDGKCPHCGQVVKNGRFHWFVQGIQVAVKKPAVVVQPSGGEEVGTDRMTVYSPTLGEDRRAFQGRHPDFDWNAFVAMAKSSFVKLQESWSNQTWELARPFETDHLFAAHRYWIEQYKAAGLVNRLESIQIGKVLVAKIETDAYYEAVTVRIYASGVDSTTDRSGKIVAGSKTKRRAFSEYWTFIRRIGCDKPGAVAAGGCPSCGAELKISMSGVCEFCGSKVVTGDFGWVLTSIDQDEEYAG
ncbi:MAG: TIM44-like domain-containing protein [Planctomycetota bacterium]